MLPGSFTLRRVSFTLQDFLFPCFVAGLAFPGDEAVKSALSWSLKDFAWPQKASEVMKWS